MAKDRQRLLVIGAGPKAAAIAAKSFILHTLGHEAPDVFIVERYEKCANWTGDHGFTNGDQILGTPPEKDVGFPYITDKLAPEVTKALFSRFSWASYLNFERRSYGDWIDRGRPHPSHKEWARYLQLVIRQAAGKNLILGTCERLDIEGDQWIAHISRPRGTRLAERFSGVVVTGPGACKRPPFDIPKSDLILYGDSFWRDCDSHLETKVDRGPEALPIVVVGGGETAAAIVSYLVDELGDRNPGIIVLTRSGAIFSRGEGYYENRRFTGERDDWCELPERVRREVIDRADRGVFSVDAMKKLATTRKVNHEFREVKAVQVEDSRVVVNPNSAGRTECQLLIWALGFDPFWFIDLLPEEIRARLDKLDKSKSPVGRESRRNRKIEALVEHDLSLPKRLVPAKLYVPMISGFAQGPGFPNLSCLGDLSDRILKRR